MKPGGVNSRSSSTVHKDSVIDDWGDFQTACSIQDAVLTHSFRSYRLAPLYLQDLLREL